MALGAHRSLILKMIYEVNLANALLTENRLPEAIAHLERAVHLDPLLQQAIDMLNRASGSRAKQAKPRP